MRHTIPRTATFAWSPSAYAVTEVATSTSDVDKLFALPLLATGTASGALDATFSSEAKLEIWAPFAEQGLAVKGEIVVSSRFNRLIWGGVSEARPRGVIVAGMDNGEMDLWDPVKILEGKSAEECLINKMTNHNGPIRGLDFNPLKPNLLASGANRGEVFIWDLNNPNKPFAPPPSRSLDDVTCVAWNRMVPSVLAASSVNGYTVVWDIREANGQKGREVAALSYNGAPQIGFQGQAMGQQYGNNWMGPQGGRVGGISTIVWHPENATKLATASEDDGSPVVMVWDLRNARAPERVMQSHEKGILGLAWCSRDADMLVSCGKDCRTICWNPQTGEMIAELAPGSNWAFQTDWCPRNPDLIATASFDGRIAIDSLQSTRDEPEVPAQPTNGQPTDGSDIFGDQGILAINNARAAVSLKQAPKWLKVPASAVFGFGGKVVTISHRSIPQAPTQPGEPAPPPVLAPTVKIRQAVSEGRFVESAVHLEQAAQEQQLQSLCDKRAAASADATSWKLLASLFRANTRDELVTLLGFSKEEVKSKVEAQIAAFKVNGTSSMSRSVSQAGALASVPAKSDVGSRKNSLDLPKESATEQDTPKERAQSEASVDDTSASTKALETESEVTEPSLFGDDPATTTNQGQPSSVDFFQSLRSGRPSALPDHLFERSGHDASSIGATAGSGSSSIVSEVTKDNTFAIYPADESKGDRLLTRALVLGDFESAVALCLSTDRYADALLLAVRGGPELLQKTQKTYFERQTTSLPYLRLYQSIVLDDLADVVQNADLSDWSEIFVVLCTFAKAEEFSNLAEQLGQRLEFQFSSNSDKPEALVHRKHATLCYLAAGRLEKVVGIWNEELEEDERERLKTSDTSEGYSKQSVRAEALELFIEKVLVFEAATQYIDSELSNPTTSTEAAVGGARTYKLATLYDRYDEYAELLVAQGLTTSAVRFTSKIPFDYPSATQDYNQTRTRIGAVAAKQVSPVAASPQKTPQASSNLPLHNTSYAPVQPAYNPPNNQYGSNSYGNQASYGATTQAYAPQAASYDSPYGAQRSTQANSYPSQASNPYAPPTNAYNAPPPPAQGGAAYLPVPPPPIGASNTASAPALAPPSKRDVGGWNDAPIISRKNAGSATGHRQAIMSPFPNAVAPGTSQDQPMGSQHPQGVAPPPRMGARTPAQAVAPPPRVGQPGGQPPYGQRPGSLGHGQQGNMLQGQGQAGASPQYGQQPGVPSQYGPPANVGQYAPPPNQGQYAPPPTQGAYAPTSNQGPYAPPVNQGPYAPPPVGQGPGQGLPPPPPGQRMPVAGQAGVGRPGGFAPPPGAQPRSALSPAPAAPKPEPPKSKYPPGDRTHIPSNSRPIFETLSRQLGQLRQTAPPAQKKMVEDTERRLNVLFDGLNCETVPQPVIDELIQLCRAIDARDGQMALQLHLALLTSGHKLDSLTVFMPAVKILITHVR